MTFKGGSLLDAIKIPDSPFPGLRPFEFNESHLFFGRDGQVEKLIEKLAVTRFLAVVGTSGSGKSSLVRAGLLPALRGGIMTGAGSEWRIAVMRPGNNPIGNLAQVLDSPEVFGDAEPDAMQAAITEATLRLGSRGLIETARQNGLDESENLLVVVDQFEELFRFSREARRAGNDRFDNDAAAFVKLLLEAVKPNDAGRHETNIYVVLTMRSDFLGDCAQFWDLPEAINESQYLIPRLTRDQLREVIEGPVALGGGQIAPRLVNQLLNDITDNQDQLPILQHALMRTWDRWIADCGLRIADSHNPVSRIDKDKLVAEATDNPQSAIRNPQSIDLAHYEAIGGMASALSRHADEAFEEVAKKLGARGEELVERMFKALTEKGVDNREVRRPATLGELCAVAEASQAEISTVIEAFRAPGRSFLMPPAQTPLTPETVIDISHESLIRNWKGDGHHKRLCEWVEDESRSVRIYQRLLETALLHRKGEAALYRNPDLQLALKWQAEARPNSAWANRYQSSAQAPRAGSAPLAEPPFATAIAFLQASQQRQIEEQTEHERAQRERLQQAEALAAEQRLRLDEKERSASRLQRFLWALCAAALLALLAAVIAGIAYRRADRNKREAIESAKQVRQLNYVANMGLAYSAFENGNAARGNDLLNAFLPPSDTISPAEDERGFEWYYLWNRNHQERTTLRGHASSANAVAFAPDGKTLLSASYDKTVKLWDAGTGQLIKTFDGHSASVNSVAFTPDGQRFASGSTDKTVRLWDVRSGQTVTTIKGHSGSVWSLAISSDGKMLASASDDRTVKLWDAQSGQELATLVGHSDSVNTVAFSPDGTRLASGSSDKTAMIWDAETGQAIATLPGHTDMINSLAFAADGKLLATASLDSTIKLWDVRSGQLQDTLTGHAARIWAVAFAPDGKTLASSGDEGTVKLWDLQRRQIVETLNGHAARIWALSFAPDSQRLASGSNLGSVKLWDKHGSQDTVLMAGHSGRVWSLAFSPDSQRLASGSLDNTLKLWEVQSGRELMTLNGHTGGVLSVAFSSDGQRLASGSNDKTLKLWEGRTGPLLLTFSGHAASVNTVAFSPGGQTLASGSSDGMVKLWDAQSGRELFTMKAHLKSVNSVVFSPDGQRLASGSSDKAVKLWDARSGQILATFQGLEDAVQALAFAPDGKMLASAGDDDAITLWEVASGQVRAVLKGHSANIWSLSFGPGGKTLASGSEDETVKLWDVRSGQELATLREHAAKVRAVAIAPNRSTLASGGGDNDSQKEAAIRLWRAATDEEVARQRNK